MEIYNEAEDSYLLAEVLKEKIPKLLKKNKSLKFLEIGSGNGLQLKTALESGVKKENIYSCDLNPEAVKHCKRLGFNCVKSDLFEGINEKFDLIVFNPPYLPLDENELENSRLATTGGKKGNEIINRFLKQAKNYLNRNGKIFLITSSLSGEIDFEDYRNKIIGKKDLFFERLFIFEIKL